MHDLSEPLQPFPAIYEKGTSILKVAAASILLKFQFEFHKVYWPYAVVLWDITVFENYKKKSSIIPSNNLAILRDFQTLWTTALMVVIIKAWFMAWLILPVFHVRLAGYKDGCKYLWFILLGVFPKKRRVVVWSSLLHEKRCRQEGFFWYFSLSVWVLRLEIWLVV